jgi:hypothetical protein
VSIETWHTYGYGVCLAGLCFRSVSKIQTLLEHAPKVKEEIEKCFLEQGITEPTADDYLDYDQDYCLGMGAILKDVIAEAEGIELVACDDLNGHIYLLYPPMYPWSMEEADRLMTEKRIESVIRKYLGIVAESDFEVDYQSAENCG